MKTRTTLIISLTAIITFAAGRALAYSGGTGDPNNPYQIATKADLLAMAADKSYYTKCFILTADINMGGQVFTTAIIAADTVAGNFTFDGPDFTGTFDGNGHKITGFTINGGSNLWLGLFGSISSGGSVKNLGLESCSVIGYGVVGGLVGINQSSISNCYSTGSVSGDSNSNSVGGLVGCNWGNISNCYSTSSVSGGFNSQEVGGLVGENDSTISNCYSTGQVSGSNGSDSVGGLVGNSDGSIINCYSTGTVSGDSNSGSVGGLVGDNGGSISNCYSTGTVSGGDNSMWLGGLVGANWYGSISNCYSKGSVSGSSGSNSVGGLAGENGYSNISNCYSTGTVTGGDNSMWLGGLVGDNDDNVSNCYSTGTVSGGSNSDAVGGLAGYNENDGNISNCYSTGLVSGGSGSDSVGGLVGDNSDGSIVSSFWDTNTSGRSTSAGGTGKTTAQMKTKRTFTTAGWNFTTIWRMRCEGMNYPKLHWQVIPSADWVCPEGVDLADFSYLAERWHTTGCNSSNNFCGGADMDYSGTVDMEDFVMFAEEWLSGE